MVLIELIIGSIAIILAIHHYLMSTYNYWRDMDISGPKPTAPFGNMLPIFLGKYNLGTYLQMIYNTYRNEPLVGIHKGREPVLVINDINIIKDVMIKDFSKFSDRGQEIHEKHEPLSLHLFNLEPKRWRPLRAKLSPIFTSGKLRDMFYLLIECADRMGEYLSKIDDAVLDMREIPARFATDVIGVCAFGLQINAIEDETNLFREMGKRIFDLNCKSVTRFISGYFFPSLYSNFIGYFTRDNILDNFIIGLTKETIEYRKKNNINRRDFVDLLMGLKNQPTKVANEIELTDKLLAAQLFVFFAAGFETSSTTIGNALYELALNQSIQNKLRLEIHNQLKRTNGKYEYDDIKNMKYLHKVIQETLRKYPPLPFLTRRSVVPYKFSGTKIAIPTNVRVWIPILGIHRDPKYYPQPNIFDPERFNEENIKDRHEMVFLPFGCGPRNCIGARFGIMQTKVGLMKILENHVVDICEKTDKTYEIDLRGTLLVPKNGIFLKVKKIIA